MTGSLRLLVVLALGALLAPLASGPPPAVGSVPPPGFRVAGHEAVAPGLEHLVFVQGEPRQAIHVARIAPDAPLALRSVTANDTLSGDPSLERTSSMCARVSCLVAVNADFADPASREPIGGVASLGWLSRSPRQTHDQLTVGPGKQLGVGPLGWSGRILSTDLRDLALDGLNVPRGPDDLVLYTPAFGRSTETASDGVEVLLRPRSPLSSLRVGQTEVLRLMEIRDGAGDTAIPPDGAVLSGHGTGAHELRDLWARTTTGHAGREVLVRVETDRPVAETVGGSPVLVRDGRRAVPDDPTSFVRGRHPRTIVGRTAEGAVLLATVDGRQPRHSRGMTLAEAADLMIQLGAVEAINLDGGGSTTFVVRGEVVNEPSDRYVRRSGLKQLVHDPRPEDGVIGGVERAVANAIAIVPAEGADDVPAPAPSLEGLEVPSTDRLPPPIAQDPGSDPSGATPDEVGSAGMDEVAFVARPGDPPYAYVDAESASWADGSTVLAASAGALALGLLLRALHARGRRSTRLRRVST